MTQSGAHFYSPPHPHTHIVARMSANGSANGSAAARPAFHREYGDLQTSVDIPQWTGVYVYAPFASHHKNNNLLPIREQKVS